MYWIKKVMRDPSCRLINKHVAEPGTRLRNWNHFVDINFAHKEVSRLNDEYIRLQCSCRVELVDHDNDHVSPS